ncbi:hypothetical protein GCM10027570_10150 [Streptomonospora sediminis]
MAVLDSAWRRRKAAYRAAWVLISPKLMALGRVRRTRRGAALQAPPGRDSGAAVRADQLRAPPSWSAGSV